MEKMTLDIQRFNSTNKTTHYELSQYISSDKPTYLVDYNDDMEAIDTGIYEAKTQADLGVNNASVAQTTAETAQTTANTAVTNAGVAQTTADANATKIGELANLTTTNKSNLVGAISEVNDKTPQMLDIYTSSTTNGYNTDYINTITEKNIITATLTADYTISQSSTYTDIPFDASVSVGNKLTLTNGKIIVGSGISHVKISGKVCLPAAGVVDGTVNLVIRKNNSIVHRTWAHLDKYNSNLELPVRVIEVQQGDSLALSYYGFANEKIAGTPPFTDFTVEAV